MHKRVTILIGIILFSILFPYMATLFFTGILGNEQLSSVSFSSNTTILVSLNNEEKTMDMEEFLVGAIPAKLPMDYHPEIYKVMATLLRTSISKYKKENQVVSAADLDISYLSKSDLEKAYGKAPGKQYYRQLVLAVKDTLGQLITYDKQPIDAMFHSLSMGKTLSAKDIFSKPYPYLVSVDSLKDVESPDYMSQTNFTFEELSAVFSSYSLSPDAPAVNYMEQINQENIMEQLRITDKTESGYVKTVVLGQYTISRGDKMNDNSFKKLWKKYGYYGALALGIFAFVCFIGVYSVRQQGNTKEEQYVDLSDEESLTKEAKQEESEVAEESKEVAAPVATTETNSQTTTESTSNSTTEATTQTPKKKEKKTKQPKSAFQESTKYAWPITGNVRLPYSMDTTVYFQTLDAYKCNPGVLIGAKENASVTCIATGTATAVTKKTMHGAVITLDVGNGYTMTYGQLAKDSITAKKGDTIPSGSTVGTIGKPSAQFTLEDPHLYFEIDKNEKPINPMDFLK